MIPMSFQKFKGVGGVWRMVFAGAVAVFQIVFLAHVYCCVICVYPLVFWPNCDPRLVQPVGVAVLPRSVIPRTR